MKEKELKELKLTKNIIIPFPNFQQNTIISPTQMNDNFEEIEHAYNTLIDNHNGAITKVNKALAEITSSDNEALTNEQFRVQAENTRVQNESERVSNEEERISEEQKRIAMYNTHLNDEIRREQKHIQMVGEFDLKKTELDAFIGEKEEEVQNAINSIPTKEELKGEKGDKGDRGEKGEQGERGLQGIQGIQGIQGLKGDKGDKGEQGERGLQGIQGLKGDKGDKGDKGEKGDKGDPGQNTIIDYIYEEINSPNPSVSNTFDGYLKDVEILGNTIQDASNLADIRSVGDKLEGQELYKIPVLSCGKNLFNPSLQVKGYEASATISENVIKVEGTWYARFNLYVKPNTNYRISYTFSGNRNSVAIYKPTESTTSQVGVGVFNSGNNSMVDVYLYCGNGTQATSYYTDFQIEEGTVATPYEPYQEDKLTILSPVQLEKVGDVADRIICKDGVWGVEKNVVTYHLKDFTHSNYSNLACRTVLPSQSTDANISSNIEFYSNLNYMHTNINYQWNNRNVNSIAINTVNSLATCDITSENYIYTDVIEMLEDNDIWVKFITKSPQFIPLPHDQQIKLRTFANKTNISFLTEIEGTIKAQVPKSLGATVNTHTEQINNLNKELDRVKKLEESTVSTVETESDFTTVEATSNGYFEDVKLEGKTLIVNSEGIEVEAGTEGATLKSVGQDVDEIVVSSQNNNHFCVQSIETTSSQINVINGLNTNNASIVTNKNSEDVTVLIYDIVLESWIRNVTVTGNSSKDLQLKSNEYVKYYVFFINEGWTVEKVKNALENIYLTRNIPTIFQEYQADKKRLLFYNNETQTWEKPILREWDSIEKHSDGKYYYHQRSGEVVLNGSENWKASSAKAYYWIEPDPSIALGSELLCDKLKITFKGWDVIEPSPSISSHNSINGIYLNYVISEVNNVDKLKQWLQANNITVVYQLAEEKVYECTNIDLITYANETNYIVESGAIVPRTTLKVHNNISNVVNILQEKVSLLENKFIQGLKNVLAGDMYSLAELLYPEDFVSEEEPIDVPTLLI